MVKIDMPKITKNTTPIASLAPVVEFKERAEEHTARSVNVVQELEEQRKDLKKWQDIFTHVRRGILVGSPDGKRLETPNPAFAKMFGYTISELVGKPIEMLIPEEYQEDFLKKVATIRKWGYLVWETMALKKDRTMFPIRVDLTVPKDEKGKPLYYIATVRDITKEKIAEAEIRKANEDLETRVATRTAELAEANELLGQELVQRAKTEKALQESNLKNVAILGSITDAYLKFDRKWQVIDFNRQAEIILGRTGEKLLGRNLWGEFPNLERDPFFKRALKVMKTNTPTHFEGHLAITDKWFEAHAYPSRDDLSIYLRDITGRKVAEESLRAKVIETERERAKDEALLASIGEGIIAIDDDERVTFLNTAAEEIFSITAAQAVGQHIDKIAPVASALGQQLVGRRPCLTSLTTKKRSVRRDLFALSRDGRKVPLNITATPILVVGEPVGAIGIYRDITKEREIDTAKSEFVALASHQLRTPLTITSWYAEKLLAGGKLPAEKLQGYLTELYRANGRMVNLVNALLDVSRLELGTLFNSDPRPLMLSETSESVLQELKLQVQSKKIKLVTQYAQKLPRVRADEKMVRIVFQNLLSNAIKYTSEGGSVKVTLAPHTDAVLITIADTGCGIPAGQQNKIFTKLFRADNARESETDGTGLGLYIVKSMVEQAGGRIWFESKEGKGTTFFVTLPIKGGRAPVDKKQKNK